MNISFPDLPYDLKKMILEFAAAIDTPTCLAVCLTDKELGLKVGRKELYRDIKILGECGDGLGHERLRKWVLLCRTLLEPDTIAGLKPGTLAGCVESMDVSLDNLDCTDFSSTLPPLEERYLQRFEKLMDQALESRENSVQDVTKQSYSFESKLVRADHYGGQGRWPRTFRIAGYVGMSIIACPNLTVLGLGGCDDDEPIDFVKAAVDLRSSPRPEEMERRLIQEVNLKNGMNTTCRVSHLLPFWPALRKATIEELHRSLDGEDFGPYDRSFPSRLQELHVGVSHIATDGVCQLLEMFPDLEILTLKWHNDDGFYGIRWKALSDTLVEHNPKLKELRLDIQEYNNIRQEPRDLLLGSSTSESLENFPQLPHLRKLAIPELALWSYSEALHSSKHPWALADILPDSIEEVEVTCEGTEFTIDNKALLHAAKTEHINDITIFNSTHDKWISKRFGEGSRRR